MEVSLINRKQIERQYQLLEKELTDINQHIKKLPAGNLIYCRNGKYSKLYISSNSEMKYIPKKNKQFISEMLKKKYLSIRAEDINDELSALRLYLENAPQDINRAASWILEKNDLSKYVNTNEYNSEISKWISEPYEGNPFYPEKLIHKTPYGIFRSKSESLIALALHEYNIPYKYECPLSLGKSIFYPDFTTNNGIIRYWEHLGIMDSLPYVRNCENKFSYYMENGIIPGINLIITSETAEHPFTYDDACRTIEYYFL